MTHATDTSPPSNSFPVQVEIVLRSTHYRLESLTINTFTTAQDAFKEFTITRQVSSARCPRRCNHLAATAGWVADPEEKKCSSGRSLGARHTTGLGTAGLRPENGRRGALQVSTAPAAPGRRACPRRSRPGPGRAARGGASAKRLPGAAAGGRT